MKHEFTLDSLRKVIASNDDATDLLNKACVDFRELQEKFKNISNETESVEEVRNRTNEATY